MEHQGHHVEWSEFYGEEPENVSLGEFHDEVQTPKRM